VRAELLLEKHVTHIDDNITAFERDAAPPVPEGPVLVYTERLARWHTTSGLRMNFRMPSFQEEPDKLPWSPDLVPLSEHPAVRAHWDVVGSPLLRLCHDRFHRFTFALELKEVTPVSDRIAVGDMPIYLPLALRRDALRIGMDEGFHAMCASQLLAEGVQAWGPAQALVPKPRFLRILAAELARLPGERLRALGELTFVVVSETLITGALAGLPKDERVYSAVRSVLAEHHREEAYHHAVYSNVMGVMWSQLDPADRAVIGPLFARFIRAFLDPDVEAEASWLTALGYAPALAQDIVKECEWRVAALRAQSAMPTIRHLRSHGVLDTPAAADALQALQLL
jgi:hypothetical protein